MCKPEIVCISYLRSRHNPRAVLVEEALNVHSVTNCGAGLQRNSFVVVDPNTGQDVTRVPMA